MDGVHADTLDLILVVLVVLSAISGYRQGFVVGILSFVGLLGGAALGAQIAPLIAKHFSGAIAPFAGVAIVFAVVQGPAQGWGSPPVVIGAVVGLVAFPLFLLRERRARRPLRGTAVASGTARTSRGTSSRR